MSVPVTNTLIVILLSAGLMGDVSAADWVKAHGEPSAENEESVNQGNPYAELKEERYFSSSDRVSKRTFADEPERFPDNIDSVEWTALDAENGSFMGLTGRER